MHATFRNPKNVDFAAGADNDMKKATQKKPFWEMSVEELAEATKEFDDPKTTPRGRPLTKAQREEFERARNAPYVSVFVGDGDRLITVAIDDKLLRESDKYARKHKLSRSELFERGLRTMLSR